MTNRCYIQISGRNDVVINAGCVEPSADMRRLSHQTTHFCDPEPAGLCFIDRKNSYPNRLSCFRCSDSLNNNYASPCSGPRDFHFKTRVLCRPGTSNCVTSVMGRSVERGCETDSVGQCTRDSPVCLFCRRSYCNGLPAVNNTGKCYTTMTDLRDIHGTTLRLMACRGLLVTAQHKPCYISQAPNSVSIVAGCVEDARDTENLVKYGDTDIIFKYKISCYKCRSARKEHCFNVRYLEPELCTAYGMVAMRGCYTLFSVDFTRIERGCLTELDDYRRHFCANEFFSELCIMCADDFCNIHDTPEEDPELGFRSTGERRGVRRVLVLLISVFVIWRKTLLLL